MKTRECIHCETLFDCKGKPSDKPCVSFKKRKSKEETQESFADILGKEMVNDANKQ